MLKVVLKWKVVEYLFTENIKVVSLLIGNKKSEVFK